MSESPAPLPPELVREFVAQAHGNFDRVKELLRQEPGLINAAWNWGGWDWETGLGAAAHTGRRDIALHLLEHGARLDLFAAAMLGWLDVVRATLQAHPAARLSPGPHGIPLMAHAEKGGPQAAAVLEFLRSLE